MKQWYLYVLAALAVIALIYAQYASTLRKKSTVVAAVTTPPPAKIRLGLAGKGSSAKNASAGKYKAIEYKVEFATNSPIKSLPLKNAKLNVRVYYYNNPDGVVKVVTDESQKFTLNKKYHDRKSVALEVVSVEGQDKYKALCFGQTTPRSNSITVSCEVNND